MRGLLRLAILVSLTAGSPALAQTVLDKVLSTVNGDVITQLDVRQARMLKLRLVTGPAEADDEVLRGLENRRLVRAEIAHVALAAPTSAEIASRRREWEASLGAGADIPGLLDRAGLTESGLVAWLRDDVRIESYLNQRFGGLPAAERSTEIARYLAMLREHAGLAKEKHPSS